MGIKPYRFRLKKVSAREQRLIRAVHEFLPATGLREGFGRGIREAIRRHLGEAFDMRLEAVERMGFGDFLARLPKNPVLAVVGLAPYTKKAIVEIDAPLAMQAIDRLLGGAAESFPEPRELSETEQGILEYLLLEIMAHVYRLCGRDARVHFRFDRFAFGAHELADLADGGERVAALSFRAALGRSAGFFRLVLPDPFVEEALLSAESPGEIRAAERAWRQREIMRFGYVRAELRAEAGRATVSAADLSGLEPGDIVLLDERYCEVDGGRPSGRVVLRIGRGMHGGLDADLEIEGGRARCRIAGVHRG